MKVSIVGAAGYTGGELCRLLAFHPQVTISGLFEARFLDKRQSEIFPYLRGIVDLPLRPFSVEEIVSKSSMVFCALPHGKSLEVVPPLLKAGLKVIDLSADFRFHNVQTYETWYQPHPAPELLKKSVYGLPEAFRKEIASASLVANPGCYPTSVLIPLIPFIRQHLITEPTITVNSLSGTSGAGRNPNPDLLFCEVSGGVRAYSPGTHRHAPEMEEYLNYFDSKSKGFKILFIPHLVPTARGILSTIIFEAPTLKSDQDVLELLSESYRDEPFVRILPPGSLPSTRNVNGTNLIEIGFKIDPRTRKTILISALDNLIKGAAGQAVQNLNILLGISEKTGLSQPPVFP